MSNKTINLSAIINNNLNNERNVTMKNDMLPLPPAEIKLEETNNLPTPKEMSIAIIGSLIDELKTIAHDNGGWYDFPSTIHTMNLKINILDEIAGHWNVDELPSVQFFMEILNKIEKEASFDYDEEIHNEAIKRLEIRFWNNLNKML